MQAGWRNAREGRLPRAGKQHLGLETLRSGDLCRLRILRLTVAYTQIRKTEVGVSNHALLSQTHTHTHPYTHTHTHTQTHIHIKLDVL